MRDPVGLFLLETIEILERLRAREGLRAVLKAHQN